MRDRIGIDATAATNLRVVGNDFLGEQLYGIRSRNNFFPNQIRIAENTIDVSETNNVAGILLERTVAATGLHNVIEGNYLTMAGSTDGKYGIHVTSPFAASDKMEIIDNIIDMTSTGNILFPIHVDANLADRFHILDNTVNFNSSNQGAERFGIVMVEGQGEAHLIKENNVIGSGTHNPGHCGLHIVNVLNTTICSNTVNHTQWGIHLWGALDPCKLQNNHMNMHEIGLFLSPSPPSVAGIGAQIRHGNTWSTSHGAYSTWAAQCATGVNHLLSPIYVEDAAPSSLNPSSALLSPSTGWFIYDPGDENYCAPLPPSFGENLSSIQEETATSNLSTYIETSLDQWQMEYNLMLSLRNNPALLGDASALSFYNSNSTTTTAGALSYSLHQLKASLLPGSTEQTEIDDLQEDLLPLIEGLIELEDDYAEALDTIIIPIDTNFINNRQELVESIIDLMEDLESLEEDLTTNRTTALEDLADFNDMISVTYTYEQNLKSVNDYLIKRALGTATNGDYEDIVDIATLQSPATSGSGVRLARQFLPLYEQVNYIEPEEAPEELQGFQPDVSATRPEAFTAYPNPANGHVEILLPSGPGGKFLVRNANGKIMYNEEVESYAVQRLSIDTTHWSAGVYVCTLHENSGQVQSHYTFVVTH